MKNFGKSLRKAFERYSIFVPKNKNTGECQWICIFIPLIGLIIGFIINRWGVAYPYLCNYSVMPAVVGAIVPIIISAGSHLVGFFGTVDAICSNKSKEERLKILKEDNHGGYFAIIVCICYFLMSIGIWSEMPIQGLFVVSFQYIISRSAFGISTLLLPHAAEGKATAYLPKEKGTKLVQILILAAYIIVSAYFMVSINKVAGIACLVGAAAATVYYLIVVFRDFAGVTEELGGFYITLCEMLMPIAVLFVYKKWF